MGATGIESFEPGFPGRQVEDSIEDPDIGKNDKKYWTLWERERVGRFGRMALKHV